MALVYLDCLSGDYYRLPSCSKCRLGTRHPYLEAYLEDDAPGLGYQIYRCWVCGLARLPSKE